MCVDCRADVRIISGDRFRGRDQLRGVGRVDAVPGRAVPLEAGQYSTVQYSTVQYSTVQYLRVGVKLGVPELAEEQSLARAAANQRLVFTLWTNERRVFPPAAAHTDHHRGPGPSGDI